MCRTKLLHTGTFGGFHVRNTRQTKAQQKKYLARYPEVFWEPSLQDYSRTLGLHCACGLFDVLVVYLT